MNDEGRQRIMAFHHKGTKNTPTVGALSEERPQRTATKNGHKERYLFLLSFKDAMQNEGAEYGAGRMPALPPLFNGASIGCEGWGIQKNVCFYYIKDLKRQIPEELVRL